MSLLIYGKGFNDAGYSIKKGSRPYGDRRVKIEWECPFYVKWKSMLARCYSKSYQKTQPTYKGCQVCEEWLTFSNFKAWMEQQDWEGKELDKDLLGDGKLYSPDNCCFLSRRLKALLKNSSGVYVKKGYKNKKYVAQISMDCKKMHLGYFASESEARKAYIDKRNEIINIFITEEGVEVQERWLAMRHNEKVEKS